MKYSNRFLLGALCVLGIAVVPPCRAQMSSEKTESKPASSVEADTQEKNVQAYVELLHRNVRQDKAEIMGVVMLLNAEDAAKFWPIYNEYDQELSQLNSQRLENIKEYARSYDQLTDEKADELIQKSVAYQKQRGELVAKTYDKVKQALGGVMAARFALAEHQLLLIIDLEMDSLLPIAPQGA
jgi:hypothetical protein